MGFVSRRWLAFAVAYCAAIIGLFVAYRVTGNGNVYVVMLVALFPTIVVTYVPIYIVVAALDGIAGSGTDGSTVTDVACILGIALSALVNVGLLRLMFTATKSCRRRHRCVATA